MLVYAGDNPGEYMSLEDSSKYFMIIADLFPGIGHEIFFFFDDYETFRDASDSLELGSWAGFSVVPHSKISFRPSNQPFSHGF